MSQKDFREIVTTFAGFAEAFEKSKEDGFSLTDFTHFIGPVTSINAAYEGWREGLDYFKNLDSEGRKVEIEYFVNEFDLNSDKTEFRIEQAARTANEFYTLLESFKS